MILNSFRPLIGGIIFQLENQGLKEVILRVSVPLSGLSSFNHDRKQCTYILDTEFPSPYRGYHLSTYGIQTIVILLFALFPSPYRDYHLSTSKINWSIHQYSFVSVPLSGLSSFNGQKLNAKEYQILFPSPYRGYHLSTYPSLQP